MVYSNDLLKLVLSYCLFVGVDIIYIDLCPTFITELCVPMMADGLGWVTMQLPTGGLGWIKKFVTMIISDNMQQ